MNPTSCLACATDMVPAPRYPGLLECPNCAFHTADMKLSAADIASLYSHQYFHGAEYGDYVRERPALQANFQARVDDINALPGLGDNAKLFEIGCAYGFFLDLARRRFATVAGIDIAEEATAFARNELGLDARQGDFLQSDLPFTPDVVCMWDVIEHLERPDKVLERVASKIAPGGYICLSTGDLGSLVARLRGPNWRMIHPPTHLHYFNQHNIALLLERLGFSVVSSTHPPVIRTIGTMLHGVLALRLGADRLYSLLSRLPGQNLSIPINLFDIMLVIARKTS